ncbi:hypothetical protein AURDEDRAFT_112046 [Auricularia subglabra TFB-10046 SS5]|nr:hypothetical protein AURDEDRAFT_112046 [Auricularia subglabra TFB-10046 SS5]
MAAPPLTLPVTFAPPADSSTSFERQCSDAPASCATAWHSNNASGVALGCADGSIFLFHPAEPGTSHVSLNGSPTPGSPALLPLPGPPSTTDSSPRSSRMANPFSLAPSRAPAATAAVSREQAEAPKNYVDFDPEQEKLQALIQQKAPAASAAALLARKHDTDEGPSSTRASSRAQSPVPAAHRHALSTAPPATSPFPYVAPIARVYPPRVGSAHGVSVLRTLEDAVTLVSLQESGDLSTFDVHDGRCTGALRLSSGPQLSPPADAQPALEGAWAWRQMHAVPHDDTTLILASAAESWTLHSADPTVEEPDASRTRIALVRRNAHEELEKIGEWTVDAQLESVGMFMDASGCPAVHYLDTESHLVVQPIRIVAPPVVETNGVAPQSAPVQASVGPITLNIPPLQIPNPFKHLSRNGAAAAAAADGAHHPAAEKETRLPGHVELGERRVLGAVRVEGDALGARLGDSVGAVWSTGGTAVFSFAADTFRAGWIAADGRPAVDVRWLTEDRFVLTTESFATTYRLNSRSSSMLDVQQVSAFSLPGTHVVAATTFSPHLLVAARTGSTGVRRIVVAKLSASSSKPTKPKAAWRPPSSGAAVDRSPDRPGISALLPVELQNVVIGYSNGALRSGKFGPGMGGATPPGDGPRIERLFLFRREEGGGAPLVFGGNAAGAVLVYEYPSLKLLKQWTKFTSTLAHVVPLYGPHVGRLQGHAFCVAEDGTALVICPSPLELVGMIPGSPAPLERIALAEDNLLLFYADGRARLWDVKTLEFWRSMARDTAEELLRHGEWLDVALDAGAPHDVLRAMHGAGDAVGTLLLDVRALNELTSPPNQSFSFIRRHGTVDADALPPDPDAVPPTPTSPQHVRLVSVVLPALLELGVNEDVDRFCAAWLRGEEGCAGTAVGLYGAHDSSVLYSPRAPAEAWTISPKYTAARLLATLTLLRICLGFSDWEKDTSAVIAFYVVSLPDAVGPAFQPPCLEYLAQYWYDASVELRQAARTLFESTAVRMTDQETIAFVERWQHELPTLQPDTDRQSARAARALLLTGHLAVEKQSLLAVSTLTDIAKSINLYLHDERSPHRTLAIELCSKGFQIWQHYVDSMEMLRALFGLATNMRKDMASAAPAARLAVLQIASGSTPLFMATLSLDVLKPRSLAHRKSTMQLIAFFIRKKPLVLYPNLTRLVEAVVKSLDPNNSTDRETVQDAATEILGQVVKTFPTVDFHGATQRLAVGTTEGAVVMYDLRTATRLYVLDGHKKRLTALSFSPDGRRLATVSLEESQVLIWKVGTSFSSFFNPGAPPRQGTSGSAPYKTYNFNVGDEGRMTIASTLDWVSFEWPADRSARLKIRDSILTFAT